MKQIYTVAASLALAASCVAAPLLKMPAKVKYRTERTQVPGLRQSRAAMHRAVEPGEPLWRPTHMAVFAGDDEGGWMHDSDVTTQWNAQGKPVREVMVSEADGERFVEVGLYTYDDRGLQTEVVFSRGETEETAEPESKLVRTYDERMPWVVTSNMNYAPGDDGEWVIDHNANNYRNTFTRDADGKVLSVVRATLFDDGWFDNTRFDVTYGADGMPTELSFSNYDYYGSAWVLDSKYTECRWDACDFQLARFDDACENGNRLVSFREADDEEVSAPIDVLYPTDDTYVMCTEDEGFPVYQQIRLYDNGGYRVTLIQPIEYGGETFVMGNAYVDRTNDLGLIDLNYDIAFTDEGIEEVNGWMQADYMYYCDIDLYVGGYILSEFYQLWDDEGDDWEDEYLALKKAAARPSIAKSPARNVSLSDLPDFEQYYFEAPGVEGEWYDVMKVEFSDYVDCAGIENVAADAAFDAPAEYFTIDGRKVANPGAGLYIVRRGNTATKVLVK